MDEEKKNVQQPEPKQEAVPETDDVEKLAADIKQYLVEEHKVPAEAIDKWKAMYRDIEFVEAQGDIFIYRGLSRMEWREINKVPDVSPDQTMQKEETVVQRCLLWPQDFDAAAPASAGIPTMVFALVARLSKFEPDFMPQRL